MMSWNGLPREIQGKILGHLPDEERCDVIPRVSKAMALLHADFPPVRKHWEVPYRPITRQMVKWVVAIAPHLDTLSYTDIASSVHKSGEGIPCLLSQLLAVVAVAAPLRSMDLDLYLPHVKGEKNYMQSVGMCSGLTQLSLKYLDMGHVHAAQIQALMGLRQLQSITLEMSMISCETPVPGWTLWNALADLPRLRTVTLDVGSCGRSMPEMFNTITKLTQIKALSLCSVLDYADPVGGFHPGIALLTQLEALHISTMFNCSSLALVAQLPLLEVLELSLDESDDPPAPLLVASTRLRRLTLRDGEAVSAASVLSESSPALANLECLSIAGMELQVFPEGLARRLTRLTQLDLSGNALQNLPPSVSVIPTLCTLNLCGYPHRWHFPGLTHPPRNLQLQYDEQAMHTLAALPVLRSLQVRKSLQMSAACGLNGHSHAILAALGRLRPDLVIDVLAEQQKSSL